jgi:hypothetical protein
MATAQLARSLGLHNILQLLLHQLKQRIPLGKQLDALWCLFTLESMRCAQAEAQPDLASPFSKYADQPMLHNYGFTAHGPH